MITMQVFKDRTQTAAKPNSSQESFLDFVASETIDGFARLFVCDDMYHHGPIPPFIDRCALRDLVPESCYFL
jgi:hypothetical protein